MIAIDERRRQDQRYDIICCVKGLDAVCSILSISFLKCAEKESVQISEMCSFDYKIKCVIYSHYVAGNHQVQDGRCFCKLMTSRKPVI